MKRFLILCLSIMVILSIASPALAANYYNQDVTAYVSSPGALTHSGKTPETLDVAVHKISGTNNPVFPFGTIIFTDRALVVNRFGTTSRTFNVQDTGPGPGLSTYWFDIWYGLNTTQNTEAAIDFGQEEVNYSTYS